MNIKCFNNDLHHNANNTTPPSRAPCPATHHVKQLAKETDNRIIFPLDRIEDDIRPSNQRARLSDKLGHVVGANLGT